MITNSIKTLKREKNKHTDDAMWFPGTEKRTPRKKNQNNVSVQFSSVAQSCPTLGDPMNHSTPGLPVHHQLPEFTQTHIH